MSTPAAGAQTAAASDAAFGVDLLRALGPPGRGVVFSPASAAAALKMALLGAQAETARQLISVLHLASPAGTYRELRLLPSGPGSGDVTFRAPNTMWVQSGLPLRPEFSQALAGPAGATVREAGFRQAPEQARHQINQVIAEQTAGKVTGLLGPGTISSLTRLVLANAVYLKAAWAHPFPERATAEAPFRPEPGRQVSVPMMRMSARLAYARGEGYQAVVLPYVGGRLALTVVLPDGPLGPCEQLLAEVGLARLLAGAVPHQVRLALPRFRQQGRLDLRPVLEGLGMSRAFSGDAEFGGITRAEPLHINTVAHMAYIAVDEHGTEAAAATAVAIAVMAAFGGTPVEVTADHPFLFAITETTTGLPLFLGRVTNPLER